MNSLSGDGRRIGAGRCAPPIFLPPSSYHLLAFLFATLIGSTVTGYANAGDGPSAFPVASTPKPLTPLMERELRGCFDFFWKEWNSDLNSPTYGMTNGDYVGLNKYSPIPVESQGFYFAAIVIGVERGWITREEGERRILITLN